MGTFKKEIHDKKVLKKETTKKTISKKRNT